MFFSNRLALMAFSEPHITATIAVSASVSMFERLPDQKRESITHGCQNSWFDWAKLDSSPTSEGECVQRALTLFPWERCIRASNLDCLSAPRLDRFCTNVEELLDFGIFFFG
jgi:hypothetical protein